MLEAPSFKYITMVSNITSPTPLPTLEEQLRSLYLRRSVVDRLIRAIETYQQVTPSRRQKKDQVA
jgi:hypothetical protein